MKKGLYRKLAWMGIKSNRQMYIPYFVMGICVIAIYYILDALAHNSLVGAISMTLAVVLMLGMNVIVFFSLTYLLYTNSFLMKRRLREFGLYNVLGMDKRNLTKILLWENGISAGICIAGGAFVGAMLEKISEVCLCRFVHEDINYKIQFYPYAFIRTIVIYAILYSIILLRSIFVVRKNNAIELLKNDNMGEKPVKANWFFAILGAVGLCWAYYIALKSNASMTAIKNFFFAVVLVIISTNLLFIAGSVALCKLLNKWKSYYYKPRHFVSVSSMTYRMKRNGMGLSVICILATMVMVMITGSGCLFFGEEESVARQHPQDSHIILRFDDVNKIGDDNIAQIRKIYEDVQNRYDAKVTEVQEGRYLETSGLLDNGRLVLDDENSRNLFASTDVIRKIHVVYVLDERDYNALSGENAQLDSDEVLLYTNRDRYAENHIDIKGLKDFRVKEVLKKFPYIYSKEADIMFSSLCLVVKNYDEFAALCFSDESIKTKMLVEAQWYYGWNDGITDLSKELDMMGDMVAESVDLYRWTDGTVSRNVANINLDRQDFYTMYGGLFFLGILLSVVFIIATVLIIYYKQITEGFEDQKRFEIMQKVGMTKKDIKQSINSQMLTVFFFPPFLAVVHLSFAMPMMFEMLKIFGVYNKPLLIGIAIACVTVFAIGYIIVYKATSNTYYKIVSGEHI